MTLHDIARKANGYVLNVAQPRRTVLLDARDSGSAVAESVPDFTHRKSHPLICFVSFSDGVITHLAGGRCGRPAGTGLRRLNLLNLTKLGTLVWFPGRRPRSRSGERWASRRPGPAPGPERASRLRHGSPGLDSGPLGWPLFRRCTALSAARSPLWRKRGTRKIEIRDQNRK